MNEERDVHREGRTPVCVSGIVGVLLPLLVVLCASPSVAGEREASPTVLGAETAASVRVLEAGRGLMLDGRFAAASDSLQRLARRPDGAVAAYHGRATVALYRFFFTEADAYAERFAAWSDSLRDALDAVPSSRADDAGVALARAEAALMRALVAGRQGRSLAAAWRARSAFRQFDRLHDAHPAFADAGFGRGLLLLTIGVLPRSYQRLLGVLGFDGDAVAGRRQLERAAREGRVNRVHAEMALGLVDLVLTRDVDAGRARLADLHAARPQSVLAGYLHGFALLTDRRADAAASVLQDAADRASSPDAFYVDYLDALLAKARFVTGAFVEAERLYRRYLGRHRGAALQATSYLYLGLAVEMQGRWEDAVPYYRLVSDGRNFPSDRAAQRWASERLERPLSDVERQLLLGRNASDAGRHDTADRILRPIYEDAASDPAHRAEAAYFLARSAHAEGRLDAALALYDAVTARPGDDRDKFGPFSRLYAGDVYAARGDTARAVRAYEAARAWPTPYDYDESLDQSVRLKRLQMEGRL